MAVPLIAMRRAVRARLGLPTSDQFMTDDVLDDHINAALMVVSSEHNWPWDETLLPAVPILTDGKLNFDPAEYRTIRAIFINDVELNEVSSSDLLRAWAGNGEPSAWAEIGGDIYVRPIPTVTNSTVIVIAYLQTDALVDDIDLPRMPAQFTGSIVAKASELLSLREDNRTAADQHANEYTQWLGRMRRSLRRSTGPVTPRIREGSWI